MAQLSARLKALEMQGYKTFASKTEFEFSPAVTAIIGPNGSGKSNIADAIRWVLGEQSFSLLRGKRTEDMIFSGSDQRARASMAAATITFDNSDGWLPIDFSEVSIGRRAYRDGTNEYILNGQRVRLRDVNELLAKCGLAERTYTIIGQGLVDAALSLRADERRELFEEAAGIGLYRSRRDEALRRLDTTKRNMERVQDILSELRPRLRSLRRQVSRSKDYDQVRSDLQEHLRTWYGYHWYRSVEGLAVQTSHARQQELERDKLRESEAAFDAQMRALRDKAERLRVELQKVNRELSERNTEREIVGRELAIAEERMLWIQEQQSTLETEITALREHLAGTEEALSTASERVESAEARRLELLEVRQSLIEDGQVDPSQKQAARVRVDQLREDLDAAAAHTAVLETRAQEKARQLSERSAHKDRILESIRDREEQIAALAERQSSLSDQADDAAARRDEATASINNAQRELDDLRTRELQAGRELNELTARLAGRRARREAIEAAMGLHGGKIKRLAEASERGEISGVLGRLVSALEIKDGYERAVFAALGDLRAALAFDDAGNMFEVLDRLNLDQLEGRLAVIPLGDDPALSPSARPADSRVLAVAADVVKAPRRYDGQLQRLLGQVLIVADRETARALQGEVEAGSTVITMAGDLYHPSGSIVLGQGHEFEREEDELKQLRLDEGKLAAAVAAPQDEADRITGLRTELVTQMETEEGARKQAEEDLELLRAELQAVQIDHQASQREIDARRLEAEELEAEITALSEEADRLDAGTSEHRSVHDRVRHDHQSALRALAAVEESSEMASVEAHLETARAELETARTHLRSRQERRTLLQEDIESRSGRLDRSTVEQQRLEATIRHSRKALEDVEAAIEQLNQTAAPIEQSLRDAEGERGKLDLEEAKTRLALQSAEREHAQAQIQLARKQEELASLRRRVEDDFGLVAFDDAADGVGQEPLPFEGIVEHLPRVAELPENIEEQVKRLRLQLRRMGPVNPEARREFREVQERVDFLTGQVDDLRKAESQIHEVIAELDVLMEREFRITFDAVAIAFKEAFTRLFGGGSARLSLTDPDDLTQSGIDIEASLPGRRMQSLAMLSGGERSLTASALVFALLKVSPTPFCVLDEVDAMLDESNVARFVDMLTELSQETQFILITHNRLTVQAAQVVYGVSMTPDQASKTISMKLDEIEKEMAA